VTFFYEDVLGALQDGDVRFVVVGGTAVILHGVPRTTADLDIVIDLEESNVRRLVAAMTRLGFYPRAPVPPTDLASAERRREWIEAKGMRAFTFQRPGRLLDEVDVIIDCPLAYAELMREARILEAGELRLPVASPRHLIQMKETTGRDQDAADADALRRLLDAESHE
jgi:hypothetical protein